MKMLSVKEVEKAVKRRKEINRLIRKHAKGEIINCEVTRLNLLIEDEKEYRINYLKATNKLCEEDQKDITKYIEESIERQKEEWEESCEEEWNDHTLYIPIFSIGYYDLNPSQKYNKDLDNYYRALNAEVIRQMVERGYKYHFCDEDIEFWREK